ncbi:MAG: type II secretion system protein GspG [bacterium]
MNTPTRKHGFTLVEIMLVVAVIGVLTMIAIPKVISAVNNARYSQAEADLNIISAAINQLMADTGKFPASSTTDLSYGIRTAGSKINEELEDLSAPDAGLLCCNTNRFGTKWQGPYLEKLPLDPWGTPYFLDPDYNVGGSNANAKPGAVRKGGGRGQSLLVNRIVVGSYGPNRGTLNTYDSDDIYIILK